MVFDDLFGAFLVDLWLYKATVAGWLDIEVDEEPDVAVETASAGDGWVNERLEVSQVRLKMGIGLLGLSSALVLEAITSFFKIWACTSISHHLAGGEEETL